MILDMRHMPNKYYLQGHHAHFQFHLECRYSLVSSTMSNSIHFLLWRNSDLDNKNHMFFWYPYPWTESRKQSIWHS